MLSSNAVLMTPDQVRQKRNLHGVPVLVAVPLEHISATMATNQLRPFFSVAGGASGGALTLGTVGRSLLLQGFAPHVANAIEMIQQVDIPPRIEPDELDWRKQMEDRIKALEKQHKAARAKAR